MTDFADLELSTSEHVLRIEEDIVVFLVSDGLADINEIALTVGASGPESPAFLAALERAMASGRVEWLNLSTYGLPPAQLSDIPEPVLATVESYEGASATSSIPEAAAELTAAIAALHRVFTKGRSTALDKFAPTAVPALAAGEDLEVYGQLRSLVELHQAGVLSDDEFTKKKAEILQRI